MKVKSIVLIVAGAVVGAVLSFLMPQLGAQVGVIVPPPEQLRFRLVGDEPIATADGHSIVAGYTVMVFRDTGTARCYVAFVAGGSISTTGPGACP